MRTCPCAKLCAGHTPCPTPNHPRHGALMQTIAGALAILGLIVGSFFPDTMVGITQTYFTAAAPSIVGFLPPWGPTLGSHLGVPP